MNVPAGRIARNLKLIGHADLGGAPNAGEGMGVKITPDGRRILYIAHENPPMAMSILEVTDPSKPTLLWQLPVPHADCRANSLIHENETEPGSAKLQYTVAATWFSAGLRIYDISDPFRPEEIAAFLSRRLRISNVFVEDRNVIYAADRAGGGLYILEYTGACSIDDAGVSAGRKLAHNDGGVKPLLWQYAS